MHVQPELDSLLTKVAQFIKLANSHIYDLEYQRVEQKKKIASELAKYDNYRQSLRKAAQALYDSDFITDELERRKFLKRAEADPAYLSSVLEKVCKAADVALIGSPARVATVVKKGEEYDPVRARAFGYDVNHPASFLEDV